MLQAFASVPALVDSIQRLEILANEQNDRIALLTAQVRSVLAGKADKRKFLTVREAAERLSVCPESVRRLVRRGLLSKSSAFRTILIPVEDVENFLSETK